MLDYTRKQHCHPRWTEMQFYFFCKEVLKPRKKFSDLEELISTLNWTNTYDCGILIDTATDMFINRNNYPTLFEAVILHETFPKAIKQKVIRRLFLIKEKDFVKQVYYIRKYNVDIKTVTPKYPKEVCDSIIAFFKTIRNLYKNIP